MVAMIMHPPYVEVREVKQPAMHPVTQDEIEHMDRIREMTAAKRSYDVMSESFNKKLNEMLVERGKVAFALADYLLSRPDVMKDVKLRTDVRCAGIDLDKLEAIRDSLPPPKDLV